MTYIELLRHPFWQKKSAEIKIRDGWACRYCTDKLSNLQVHHLYYNKELLPWQYPDEALITLCDLCHKKAEFIKWINRFAIKILLTKGFLNSDAREIRATVIERVELNNHRESVEMYMDNIKKLIHE